MEFFARVEIREATNEAGESDLVLNAAITRLRQKIDALGWGDMASDRNQIAEVRHLNGVPTLIVHGAQNHNSGTSDDLVQLLTIAGREAPGSYGFAWFLDWEHENSWKVHTLIRGEVVERRDPWFSPLMPVVEDDPETAT